MLEFNIEDKALKLLHESIKGNNKCYLNDNVVLLWEEGEPYLVATNGHILTMYKLDNFTIDSETKDVLEKEKLEIQFPKGLKGVIFVSIDSERRAVFNGQISVKCEDINYPDVFELVPKSSKKAEKFAMFNFKYLKILFDAYKLVGKDLPDIPKMENETSPAFWEIGNFEIVIMPYRA